MQRKLRFSIIVPFYQNELNVPHTLPVLWKLADQLPDYEVDFIFIEDGSSDRTFQQLKSFVESGSAKVKLIKLSRNFGQIAAIRAGLSQVTGDCAGIISADLQDPPALFIEMLKKWREGAKLVIAERIGRDEGVIQRLFSSLYWRMVRRFALKNYPTGGFDFCVLDRVIVENMNELKERNTQIFPLIFSLGYSRAIVPYRREQRIHGESQWTFTMKFKLFLDTFIAFSYLPIRCISAIGLIMAFLSMAYGATMIFLYLKYGNPFTGWTSIIVLLSIIGGLILLTLGIIGEYLWRILDQVRSRPQYLIDEVFEKTN